MRCEILAVGTEILLGDIVNTNAQYISKRLSEEGIFVYHQSVIGDNPERLKQAYELAFSRADLVITTGGLGPTKDDLTKEIAFEYFGMRSVCHEESLNQIKEYFEKINKPLGKTNEKQAYFPEEAIVLKNNNGTAPGCILEEAGKVLVMLPGPPREMKAMFEESVIPYLRKYSKEILVSKILRVIGVGESAAAELIGDLIDNENPTVAPYAKEGEMIFRITARAESEEVANKLIAPVEAEIRSILGDNIYGEGETTLEDVLGSILVGKGLTIATAESCTGGMVAARLINYPGISASILEGAVTYSNEAKIRRLGVKEETLNSFGAVSEETAIEMAKGIASTSGADIGIATTGIAGPGGGTEEKPVGLVYIAVYYNNEVEVRKLNLSGNRQRVRERAATAVIDMVRRKLL
ncbi:MAG: competence/damage-inducible protein A [Clostridium sp.]|uniref:competence/damage-inducible protein A n=1 Tax=Clostridium culturomicium TaxID=1499683 RepID=UPI00058EE732|nr:competence/damage-inducible protein A [Clostridium culturomicium]MDU4891505.1 competence/damage-inducible protein A [Clostridium sp.]MDU7085836.1 competence/damage-inducible protein A [Clostridium sp.]